MATYRRVDDLTVTCRLTACTPGSAPGPMLFFSYLMQNVQSVQNAAARLITGTRRCEHIIPVLPKLHWLPVRQRVEFKLACLVHQSLSEQTPSYLASDIQLTTNTGRPQLRSASERICVVPRTHSSFGDRSFSAASPRVWNALPSYLRQDMSYSHFKHALK